MAQNMDFIERLREIGARIPKLKEQKLLLTEEGTKNALVMPFINALGYNVFDPLEVTPEFGADLSLNGIKKGEKVDYAIMSDGQALILFECKTCGTDFSQTHGSQLMRYFSAASVHFGVLTDGVVYQFYTDLDAPNKMDAKPFLAFDMTDIKEPLVEELRKFTKGSFDIDRILSTASDLKYTSATKKIIAQELSQPTDEFVRFFANQVYHGRMTQNVLVQFREVTKRAWREVISERMQETFVKAAQQAKIEDKAANDGIEKGDPAKDKNEPQVITTKEEIEAYYIVRSIVRETVDVKRVAMRDVQSYCSVLLDDNNRKPICRFYFNATKKYLGLFDHQRQETKIEISDPDAIYNFVDQLKTTIGYYGP